MARKPPRRAAAIVKLADALDLPAAAPLAAALLARRGQDLSLDAGGVQRLGGQCLQVLLAARSAWAADAKAFRIVAASAEFSDAANLMGAAGLVTAGTPSTPEA